MNFTCEDFLIELDELTKLAEGDPRLAQRKRQVFNESIEGAVPSTGNYLVTNMAIQDHRALKAGQHFDVRFNIKGRGVSFVTRKHLPAKPGEVHRLVRTPDHRVEYMNWEGEIPYGQYGGGRVMLHDKQDVVIKSDPDKINIDIPAGPNKGRFVVFKNLKDWFIARRAELPVNHAEKEKFKAIQSTAELGNPDDYIAMRKMDGAHFIATIGKGGTSFVSAAKSVDGGITPRQDSLPHLRELKSKKYDGMVIRGELWHPNGFNVLSGILNSNTHKAVMDQAVVGHVRFSPFDIVSLPNGESAKNLPFSAKLEMLKDLAATDFSSMYVKLPEYAETPEQRQALESKMLGNPKAEGLIYRHKTSPEVPPMKLKNWFDYDLKVIDTTPGTGMFSGGVGALVLADKTGKVVGKVSAGLSNTERMNMGSDPSQIVGKIVKVKTMEPLVDQIRAPKFQGISDKTEPDEFIKQSFSLNMDIEEMIFPGIEKEAIIKQQGDKYKLMSSDGKKTLGTHPDKERALAQERAIQANKHKHAMIQVQELLGGVIDEQIKE